MTTPLRFNDPGPDIRAYRAQSASLAPGADAEVSAVIAGMADLENAYLKPLGLQASYAVLPTQISSPAPWICHLPLGVTSAPVFTHDGGFPGGMVEMRQSIDIYIAGGTTAEDYPTVMARAYALYLPLWFLYAKNGNLGGLTSGTIITGADPSPLPLGTTEWYGLAVHTTSLLYYQMKAS